MTTDITSPAAGAAETEHFLGADWFDPLEAGVRTRIRSFIEELLKAELEAALSRKRYARRSTPENGADGEEARPPVLSVASRCIHVHQRLQRPQVRFGGGSRPDFIPSGRPAHVSSSSWSAARTLANTSVIRSRDGHLLKSTSSRSVRRAAATSAMAPVRALIPTRVKADSFRGFQTG